MNWARMYKQLSSWCEKPKVDSSLTPLGILFKYKFVVMFLSIFYLECGLFLHVLDEIRDEAYGVSEERKTYLQFLFTKMLSDDYRGLMPVGAPTSAKASKLVGVGTRTLSNEGDCQDCSQLNKNDISRLSNVNAMYFFNSPNFLTQKQSRKFRVSFPFWF